MKPNAKAPPQERLQRQGAAGDEGGQDDQRQHLVDAKRFLHGEIGGRRSRIGIADGQSVPPRTEDFIGLFRNAFYI